MPAIDIVSSVFDCLIVPWKSDTPLKKFGSYLGKATLDLGKLDLGLVSAGANGIEP